MRRVAEALDLAECRREALVAIPDTVSIHARRLLEALPLTVFAIAGTGLAVTGRSAGVAIAVGAAAAVALAIEVGEHPGEALRDLAVLIVDDDLDAFRLHPPGDIRPPASTARTAISWTVLRSAVTPPRSLVGLTRLVRSTTNSFRSGSIHRLVPVNPV